MKKIRVVFWGSPVFAIPSLQACIDHPAIDVVAVITQPDKPQGRSGKPIPSAVAALAEKHAIPALKPISLKNNEKLLGDIGEFDLNVVVAYGKLIPPWAISYPNHETINVHPSLLPRHRGPSPIQQTLLSGDAEAGVTIMQIDEEMDHGPILSQTTVPIHKNDTYATLAPHLATLGAELLVKTILLFPEGRITPKPQKHEDATYSTLLKKDDGQIDWSASATTIVNMIHALNPWPGTYTMWNGKQLKITKAYVLKTEELSPGKVETTKDTLLIGTSDYDVEVLRLQLEGKTEQDIRTFVLGHPSLNNSVLPS